MQTNLPRRVRGIPWRAGPWLCGLCVLGCSSTSTPKPADPLKSDDNVKVPAINAAANDAVIHAPLDATPSPQGDVVYYTAFRQGDDGEDVPGIYTVAADGSGGIQTLAEGSPLLAPVGISVSLDGTQLFIADAASGTTTRGAILTLPTAGGSASPLGGSEGYAPAGLTIAKVKDQEYLYFTGHAPDSGAAGLFRIAANGGAAEAASPEGTFDDPSGVTVSASGDAYVVETGADEAASRVVRIRDGVATNVVTDIGIGFPAGITLTHDEGTLLVSGLDPATKHDVVYFVDVASGKQSRLTQTVGAFAEAAGLHRAHDADVFAWADSEANTTGTVYVLKP
jgi:hypothetical protein